MSQLSVNAIRFLGIDAIEKSKSGHPGVVMGAAPMAYDLFTKQLRINPAEPNWINRDRFVLSAGHGSMLLYALLYLSGFKDVSMEETSANGALRHQVTQSLVIQLELMRRLDHWDKGFLQRLDLLKQSVSWLLSTTVMVIRFSTITHMSSVVMAI